MAESLRVLMANEPRSYRDVHGAMLRQLFPGATFQVVESDQVPAEFAAFAPHLVICSTLTKTIKDQAFAWILLYPDDANLAVVCVDNQQSLIQAVTIEDLATVVERVADCLGFEAGPARLRAAEEPAHYDSAQHDDAVPDREEDGLQA